MNCTDITLIVTSLQYYIESVSIIYLYKQIVNIIAFWLCFKLKTYVPLSNFFKFPGSVLLDKIPTARTVVNKLDIIDSTFRNFEMEVLAGENDFVTLTKENGLSYKLDFSKVYWNPRLGE